jgi:hypothetical protein
VYKHAGHYWRGTAHVTLFCTLPPNGKSITKVAQHTQCLRMKDLLRFASVAMICFGSVSSAAWGQNFPGFSGLSSPSVIPAISPADSPVFSPDVGINCPTPSLTVAGYGSNADNWANYPESADARSGIGNFGVVAGVSVPFGGSLSRYCKDYAAGLLRRQEADAVSRRINNQVGLVNSCIALKDRVDFSNAAFDTPEFESLRDCRVLKDAFKGSTDKQPSSGTGAGAGLLETTPKREVMLTFPVR